MEDEDDSYGFGSYAQLFDGDAAASADPAPALDAAAVRRFWMPERLLRQLRSGGETGFGAKEFQHVAARLDGRVVDGGLGRASLAHPRDAPGGGVLWLQAAKSDSNAQQRRRRQLGADARSPAALFVPLADVEGVKATVVQNTVQAVELALVGGHVLHLAFLPGPFFHANHRDEFLTMVNQRLDAQRGAGGMRRTEGEASDADSARRESPRGGNKTLRQAEADADADADTTRRDASLQVDARKEAMRALVRRYSTLDALSDEAIQLARQVHEATGYHLGPLAKKFPRFSADATHRKQAVQQLSKFLTKMNDEWSRADAHRELHTNTRSFRNQDELFQYTDAATGEDVSPRSYESRYAQYAGLDESDPVIRCVSFGEATSERVNAADSYKAKLSALLGVDVSSSCVIDEAFFKDDPADDSQQSSVPDMQSEAAAAHRTLWQRWEAAFSDYMKQRDVITGGLAVNATAITFQASSSGAARKRPRDRRRSILPPSEVAGLDELVATNASPSERAPHDSEPSSSHGKRRRRSSSSSLEHPADSASARRKVRRQSITGSVDTSVLASGESKEDAQKSAGTPAASKRGQPSSLEASSNDEEAGDESKERQEELCQLCFSERGDVEMDPCAHRVCGTCWERLDAGGGASSDSCGQRVCPWDRELVSKR